MAMVNLCASRKSATHVDAKGATANHVDAKTPSPPPPEVNTRSRLSTFLAIKRRYEVLTLTSLQLKGVG